MFNKKILYLGNNDNDTDLQVSFLALKNKTTNNGLVNRDEFIPTDYGFYHTSLVDLSSGNIVKIARFFDKIVLLDQSYQKWSNHKLLFSTFNLMLELETLGHATEFRKNLNIKRYLNFHQLVKENKSFCIYPWIQLIEEDGKITLCARSETTVTTRNNLQDWKSDKSFVPIRKKMLAGEKLPTHCQTCYRYEDQNIESYRQFDTKFWLSRLDIESVEDLEKIENPHLYEVRLNNKCNLMCRSCHPGFSHLIAREARVSNLNFFPNEQYKYCSLDIVDIEKLNSKSVVYLTGGEPTIISDVYKFMQQCIDQKRTEFELTFSTNGMKFSEKFVELSKHFPNLNLSFSIDGFEKVNDYWRWKSNWQQIIHNAKLMRNLGHNININCVPGLYNVTNLHLLYEFLDKEFPLTTVYLQINHVKNQSPFNHPNAELVVKSMEKCMQTGIYYSDGKSNKTTIDSLYHYYNNNPQCDLVALKDFFVYNDTLDNIRNVKLKDYIPELDDCRKFLTGS